jgi:aryl-alcohol dehydrogenase
MKIRAAVARAGEPFALVDCELEAPRRGEVLVKIEACGICHTDLAMAEHGHGPPLPAVFGHEGVGVVLALGEGVTRVALGDRVLMSFAACEECASCLSGHPSYCRRGAELNLSGRRADGSSPIARGGLPVSGQFFGQSSFATHAVVATTNLIRLADDLPGAPMTGLACGVMTGVGAVVNVLQAGPDDALAVLGCGAVGLSAVMAARLSGCRRIVAVDVRRARLDAAVELGATDIVDNTRDDAARALRQLAPDLAFDTTAQPAVIAAALAALRTRGRLVFAGLAPRGQTLELDANRLMMSGKSIRGTAEGDAEPRTFIPKMIAWYRAGELPLDRLVTTYPFDQINDAAADMRAGRAIKPVLLMPPS